MKAPLYALAAAGVAMAGAPGALAGRAMFSVTPVPDGPSMPRSTSYFVLDARPGSTIVEHARVTNTGAATATATIYAVDAATGRTSGAVYRGRHAARRDVGAWTSLGRRTVTLAPGQSALVGFRVRVPSRARAGDHLGGIVAASPRTVTSRPTRIGRVRLRLRVRFLSIAAVLVRLPGGRCRMSIGGVRADGRNGVQYLYVGLRNSGERLTRASGVITLSTGSGQRVARRRFTLDTLVPRTAIRYPVRLGGALPSGHYRARVSLAGCSTTPAPGSSRPWVLGLGVLRGVRVTKTVVFTVSRSEHDHVLAGRLLATSPTEHVAGRRGGTGSAVSKAIEPTAVGAAAGALVAAFVGLPALLLVGRRRRLLSIRGDDDDLD